MAVRSASLGQIAVHAGVLPEEARLRLTEVMRDRVRAGRPVSFARLLLQSGLDVQGLHTLLARGASFEAVRCDACGELRMQTEFTSRREQSCARCGALLLGFTPFVSDVVQTMAYRQVIPLPGAEAPPAPVPIAERTLAYGQVLDVPSQSGIVTQDVYVLPNARGARTEEESLHLLSLATASDAQPVPTSSSGSSVTKLPFKSVGGFRLIKAIGEGGMGQVFLAEDGGGERVALKLLHPDRARGTTALQRFQREAQALSQVEHANVVGVKGHGQDPSSGVYFLALEYLAGGSLADRLTRDGPLGEADALRIARGVASALEAAAALGVVHRDVKPGNILLADDGEPKLADLGLIKDMQGGVQITATGLVMGTPAFMSPEQASGDRDLDVRTDLYALGCCIYQTLTGKVPFVAEGLNIIDIVRRRLREDLPDVRLERPDVSGAAAQLVRWLTVRGRAQRYPRPALVMRDIDRVLAGGDPLGPADDRVGDAQPPLDRKRKYAPPVAAAAPVSEEPRRASTPLDPRLLIAAALVLVFVAALLVGLLVGELT